MALSLFALVLLLNAQGAPKPVTPEEVVKRFFDAYQRLDVDGMTAVMAPDMVFDDPTFRLHANSRAEWRKQAEGNRLVITHIGIEVHSTVRSGDTVATELTLSGGIKQKDGRVSTFKVRGASFFRVTNGLITRWTDYMDFRTFSEQTSSTPRGPSGSSSSTLRPDPAADRCSPWSTGPKRPLPAESRSSI